MRTTTVIDTAGGVVMVTAHPGRYSHPEGRTRLGDITLTVTDATSTSALTLTLGAAAALTSALSAAATLATRKDGEEA